MQTQTAGARHEDLSERQLLLFQCLLVVYAALQVLFRTSLAPAVELDEGEQLVHSVVWSWGYHHNPPLYTWLQLLVFELLGVGLLGLSLLKSGILLLFNFGVCRAILRLGGSRRAAIAGTCAVFLIPSVAFLAQRDLTHSVLATALAPWALIALWDVFERRRLRDYLALALWFSLGLLSKYLFFMLMAALIGLGFADRGRRAALLDWRMLLVLLLPAAVSAPHFLWMAEADAARAEIERKLRPSESARFLESRGLAVWKVALAALETIAGLLVIAGIAGRAALLGSHGRSQWPEPSRFLLRSLGLMLAGIGLAALAGILTDFKARWFLAAAWAVPVALVLAADRLGNRRTLAWLGWAGAVLAIGTLIGVPARAVIGARTGSILRVAAPFDEVAHRIAAELPGGGPRLVLASDRGWGGSWRLQFPEDDVRVPEFPLPVEVSGRPVIVLWEATPRPRRPEPGLPEPLRQLALETTGVDPADLPHRMLELPYRFGSPRKLRVVYTVIEPLE